MRAALSCLMLAACGGEAPRDPPRYLPNGVDVLFAIDDTIDAPITELLARVPMLIQILDDFGKTQPVHYHLGVVTSDLGAASFTLAGTSCHPGGDGGKLQPLGAGHAATCQPPAGNFIDWNQGVADNLPAGQDLTTTLGCMLSVGNQGCTFPHQLESVYRALHDSPSENQGFLRPGAQLAIFWLTAEDDCSAAPDSDLFDPSATQYGPILPFRCTQYGIACGKPPKRLSYQAAQLSDCVPATADEGGKLLEVGRYVDWLTQPSSSGGVKVDPSLLIVGAIAAPPMPVTTIVENVSGGMPNPYGSCPNGVDGKSCVVALDRSCTGNGNSQIFGQPALRLDAVVNAAKTHQLTGLCDWSYTSPMLGLGQLVVASQTAGCLGAPLVDRDCLVEDITVNADGSSSAVPLPACASGGPRPCWSLDPICDSGTLGVHVDRGGATAPENLLSRYACRTRH